MRMIKGLAIAVAVASLSVAAAAVADISGAGATFPYPIYAKWADAYKKLTGVGAKSGRCHVTVTIPSCNAWWTCARPKAARWTAFRAVWSALETLMLRTFM